jgi:hypothetical protein
VPEIARGDVRGEEHFVVATCAMPGREGAIPATTRGSATGTGSIAAAEHARDAAEQRFSAAACRWSVAAHGIDVRE